MTIASSVQHGASVGDAPSADEIRTQMRRILADPTLQASPRRRELLRFVVEETLAGRAGLLKGFTIALAVFGRKDDFDPQADPVVRVEVRRLRRDLDSYYVAAGSRDPLRITIPKGGYVPHFEWREQPSPGSTAPAAEPAAAMVQPSSPGTRGRAGIGSRPPSLPVRFSGRWDGLARTCWLPDCGPAAAGTR